jgi:uncharacterized protein
VPTSPDQILTVGNAAARPGELALGGLVCAYLPDASPVTMPLILLNGAQPGPVVLMTAAVHGIEVGGIEVIRRLTREIIDAKTLRGAIIAAPIVNPLAYRAARMNTPQDEYNLNRVFPGGADQLLSHRLADIVIRELVAPADYVIDFHSNVTPSIPFSIIRRTGSASVNLMCRKMADAFGITVVEMVQQLEQHRTGTMSDCALADGKPTIVIELIDTRRLNSAAITMGVRGTLNVLKVLGLLHGALDSTEPELKVHQGSFVRMEITANKGGLVHLGKDAGDHVSKGDVLATLYDPWGDVVDVIKSPVHGYVLAYPLREVQAVATGNMIVFIAFDPSQQT